VVIRGEDRDTGKMNAEVVARWMSERGKVLGAVLEKLEKKNEALDRINHKLEGEVSSKDDDTDRLHYIDFHQLRIENKQYLAKVEERNAQLLQLKLSTGRTSQLLASQKKKLTELSSRCTRLASDIASRTETLERLRRENARVSGQVADDAAHAERLGVAVDESEDLPGVQDYVDLRAKHADMTKELASWRRKVEIADMATKKSALRLQTAKRAMSTATPGALEVMASHSSSKILGSGSLRGSKTRAATRT
jgi:chromosome segregation ATPase